MNKRVLALLVAVGMLLAIIVGCAQPTETTTTAPGQTTTRATTTGTTSADGPQVTAPGELPVTTEPVTLTMGLTEHVRVADYDDNFMTHMVRDEVGIHLEFELFPTDQPQQRFQLMVSAGQELPDIVHFGFTDAQRAAYGRDGIFIPLNDYMDNLTFWYDQADVTQEEYEQIKILGTSPDGNFYGFPAYMDGLGDVVQYMTNINRTWLDTLDLDMPTTTEEFREVLIAFRDNDPNQNGIQDEIPFLAGPAWSGNTWHEIINSFVYWQPWYATSYFNVTNGELWAPFVTEEWRNALRYMRDLVDDGLMSELSFSITGAEYRATVDLTPDQINTVGVIGGHWVVLWASGNEHVYEWDALPALEGPEGVSWIPTRTANYQYSTFITKDNPYPEISFRMFDYWWEEKRSLITRYGEPGVHWDYYKDDLAGFNEKYPYKSSGAIALDVDQPIHIQVPGVQNPWTSTEPHNAIWNNHFACGLPMRTYSGSASVAPIATYWGEALDQEWGPDAHRQYLSVQYFALRAGLEPEETAKRLIFNEQEENDINEIRTTINSYIHETIALFVTGAMDVERDWDAYVRTLNDMGLELYRNTSQAAYDRMYK